MSLLTLIDNQIPRTLYHILTVPDAAVSWRWTIDLPSLPEPIEGLGNSKEDESLLDKVIGFAKGAFDAVTDAIIGLEPLTVRAESVHVPLDSINVTSSRNQARNRSFADSISTDDLTITFYEDYNYSALNYFERWKKVIANDYGVFRCPDGSDGYAKTIRVNLFDTVGLKKGVIFFYGAFPVQIQPLDLGSENGIVKTSVTFSVQRAEWQPFALLNSGMLSSAAQASSGNALNGNFKMDVFNFNK